MAATTDKPQPGWTLYEEHVDWIHRPRRINPCAFWALPRVGCQCSTCTRRLL